MNLDISKIIRTNRKTIALQIEQSGCLVIRAPLGVKEGYIRQLVHERRFWINRKRSLVEKRNELRTPKRFIDGEEFLYLGNKYKLRLVERIRPALVLNGGFSLSKQYIDGAREVFIEWYIKKAKEEIKERVNFYISLAGFSYNKIRITGAQSRWGSCSSGGNLNFSWRLIMAPHQIIDYVVVHEIAHLAVRNHSRKFWQKVEGLLPEYKKYRKWLKEKGFLLNI